MECRGNRELFNSAGEDIGSNQFGSTLHFGMNRTTDMWRLAHFKKNLKEGWNTRFHTYGMIWSPGMGGVWVGGGELLHNIYSQLP